MSDPEHDQSNGEAPAPPPGSTPPAREEGYRDPTQVRKAVAQYGDRTTRPYQRIKILNKLMASDLLALEAIPTLLETFRFQDMQSRHTIIDICRLMVKRGGDLSESAPEIARHLRDANFALREKVKRLLMAMGPDAVGGVPRILGALRHNIQDVRLAAVQVLGTIGPACAEEALPRLQQLLHNVPTSQTDMREEISIAIDRITGRIPLKPSGEADAEEERELEEIATSANRHASSHDGEEGTDSAAEAQRAEPAAVPAEEDAVYEKANRVYAALEILAAEDPSTEETREKITEFQRIPRPIRLQALRMALRSDHPQTRSLGATLMTERFEEFVGLGEELTGIYRDEPVEEVRFCLADLLSCIFCYLTLPRS